MQQLTLLDNAADNRLTEHQNFWARLARGKFTSSQMHRLMTEPKNKADKEADALSQKALEYVAQKAGEEIAMKFADVVLTEAQKHGVTEERNARRLFEQLTGKKVLTGIHYLYNLHSGGAPDGEVAGENAIIEIKCPYNTAKHIEHMMLDSVEDLEFAYQIQMQANMLFGKKEKCYFISYDDRVPTNLQVSVIEVPASPEIQQRIKHKLSKAIAEKERQLEELFKKVYHGK